MGVLSSSPANMDQCIEECVNCARTCERMSYSMFTGTGCSSTHSMHAAIK